MRYDKRIHKILKIEKKDRRMDLEPPSKHLLAQTQQ